MSYHQWAPYVPVAQRRAKAQKQMKKLQKQGKNIQPIEIEGRKITHTFWGNAWGDHLEQFSDYANRLPRGRSYVRNGSVCHLAIKQGKVEAIVSGSSSYNVAIEIKPLAKSRWTAIKKSCAGQIGSMLELLQGKLSNGVMQVVTDAEQGLFPEPKEIQLRCSCPDWATMCKHVAAVLYGVGARLDHNPELIFLLRGVDHHELISTEMSLPNTKTKRRKLTDNLSDVFDIDIDDEPQVEKRVKSSHKKTAAKNSVAKKSDNKRVIAKSTTTGGVTTSKKKQTKQKAIRPTGKTVMRLRQKFTMNYTQFACLVGVSAKTITTWESQSERLNLRPESLAALAAVVDLNKAQAWKQFNKLAVKI